MDSPLNIAFAGLGAMGFGMASHLLKLGNNVTGYDVYEPSLAKFREVGGRTASSPRQAAQGGDLLICMVANAQQAESVLFDSDNGAVQGMRQASYSRENVSDILQYLP
jgi:3-hydroxyisobutyrate dehydrogenase-like beta-hydroxyacid dehydrogenase